MALDSTQLAEARTRASTELVKGIHATARAIAEGIGERGDPHNPIMLQARALVDEATLSIVASEIDADADGHLRDLLHAYRDAALATDADDLRTLADDIRDHAGRLATAIEARADA